MHFFKTDSSITHSKPDTCKSSGERAETTALHFLTTHGLKLITQNYRVPCGEIDLIMEDKDIIAFIEVRYRKRSNFGSGAETVTYNKQKKLTKAALHFIQKHPKLSKRNFRFDVISISLKEDQFKIDWIDNAFEPTLNY
jgi:putative endonuclease